MKEELMINSAKRIGIIGTGRIAKRFVPEVDALKKDGVNIIVSGVYNPNYDSAVKYADGFGIEAYRTIDELISNSDIIYVASPHETHYEYAKICLCAGKNVLCEKPMCFSKKQSEKLYNIALNNKVLLFEGLKTAFCPGFIELIKVAKSNKIGDIKNIEACFTKLEDKDKRELKDVNFGGSFTELGSYVMLPLIKLFDLTGDKIDIRFDSIYNALDIDIFTRCTVTTSEMMTTLTCGLGVKSEGRLLISGTKGYIVVPAPWWKTNYFEVHYEDASKVEKYECEFLGDGLRYEIMAMLNEETNSEVILTPAESIKLAFIFEKFMAKRKKTDA